MSALKQIIALDAGTRQAKLVKVSLDGGRPVVSGTESFSLPMEEEEPHTLVSAWIDSLGLGRHFCATALPGTETVFKSGRIMPNDPRTPDEVAAMDIAQFSDMAGDEMRYAVFAFHSPEEPNVRQYLMTMARPDAIRQAIRETRLNHLRPADIISAPVALYQAVEFWARPHRRPWCAISIGHSRTELEIGLKEGILFARAIPLGGKIFTDAVAGETGLPAVQAEARKHNDCGLRESDACWKPLRAAADRWLSQLNAALGVYRSEFQDRRLAVEKIVLCGGGSRLRGFREYLAMKSGLDFITLSELRGEDAGSLPPPLRDPAGTAPSSPSPGDGQDGRVPQGFEIAFGLALTALHCGSSYLSLLPEPLKDEVIFEQKKPWWLASGLLVLAAMALYALTGFYLIRRDRALLERQQERLRTKESVALQVRQTRERCTQILAHAVPLDNLLINGPLARDLLSLVASRVDENDWITLFCDESIYNPQEQEEAPVKTEKAISRPVFTLFHSLRSPKERAGKPEASAIDDGESKKKELLPPIKSIFIVEGYTPDPSLKSVREMIGRLRTAPLVRRVDLRSDDKVLKPTGIPELEGEDLPDFKRFVIEIEVNRP